MRYLPAIGLLAILAALTAACGGSTAPVDTATPTPASGDDVGATATATAPAEQSAERQTGEVEGIVFVVGEESEATFTVEEQLARLPVPNDAVMRTSALSGEVSLDGGASTIEIDLSTLTSDQGFRDRYVSTRMFGSHPTAVFKVPDTGDLPAGFGNGETVTTSVMGTLTLLGEEFPLSFDIEARDDGHTVFVLGTTQFTWEELEVPVPQVQSVVWIADDVRVQVLLALEPSGAQ